MVTSNFLKTVVNKSETDLTILRGSQTSYPSSPDEATLETFKNKYPGHSYTIKFECPEFTSLCPITGQPDFAKIVIEYIPQQQCIESKSLKLYLFSFRNHGDFGEAIVNRILDDLVAACSPKSAKVIGDFSSRGGISIEIVAHYPNG